MKINLKISSKREEETIIRPKEKELLNVTTSKVSKEEPIITIIIVNHSNEAPIKFVQ